MVVDVLLISLKFLGAAFGAKMHLFISTDFINHNLYVATHLASNYKYKICTHTYMHIQHLSTTSTHKLIPI